MGGCASQLTHEEALAYVADDANIQKSSIHNIFHRCLFTLTEEQKKLSHHWWGYNWNLCALAVTEKGLYIYEGGLIKGRQIKQAIVLPYSDMLGIDFQGNKFESPYQIQILIDSEVVALEIPHIRQERTDYDQAI